MLCKSGKIFVLFNIFVRICCLRLFYPLMMLPHSSRQSFLYHPERRSQDLESQHPLTTKMNVNSRKKIIPTQFMPIMLLQLSHYVRLAITLQKSTKRFSKLKNVMRLIITRLLKLEKVIPYSRRKTMGMPSQSYKLLRMGTTILCVSLRYIFLTLIMCCEFYFVAYIFAQFNGR